MRRLLLAVIVGLSWPALAQVAIPEVAGPAYAYEDQDAGVKPTSTVKRSPYHAATPTSIPGARVIRTLQLKQLLADNADVVVIDVLTGSERRTVPGAVWVPDGGLEPKYGAERGRFEAALQQATGGNKSRPVVFLCLSSECWLSYNAALDAVAAGYTDVIWYRGGTDAWRGASLKTAVPRRLD